MRVLIHTFTVSLLLVLGIVFFWRPAPVLLSITPVNWAKLYEKAHPFYKKTNFPWSKSQGMHQAIRQNTTGHQSLTSFIGEKTQGRGVIVRDEVWLQWKALYFHASGTAPGMERPVFMATDDPMAALLVRDHGYLTIADKDMETFAYTRLLPSDQYGKSIPSAMHYPFRKAAAGLVACALVLSFLRPKSLGPVLASTPGKGSRVFLFILALGLVGTALPWIYGLTRTTLYGIAVMGGFILLFGIIGTAMFGRETVLTHRLLQGQGLVAHWTYTDAEWQAFSGWSHQESKKRELAALVMITLMCLAIAGGFWIVNPDLGGAAAFCVIAGLMGFIWVLVGVKIFLKKRKNGQGTGEVYIGEKIIYINGSVVSWGFLGCRLESMTLHRNPVPVITLVVSVIMMAGRMLFFFRQNYTYQIPVPLERIQEAREVIEKLTKK